MSNTVSAPLNKTKLETPLSLIASTGLVNNLRKDQVTFFVLNKSILYIPPPPTPPHENVYKLRKVFNLITLYSSKNTGKACVLQF